jgi:hypothetical protein
VKVWCLGCAPSPEWRSPGVLPVSAQIPSALPSPMHLLPILQLSLKSCTFGECPVNEVRDVLLTVKNAGSMLPFNFAINKVH